ncbi:MAG TPA: PfkB family carbohydrate kinase [Candidatus Saccharimonadales bacterium]|nr:PfkB family carbohydrate kinase [Candidatus Saccharimonadales bacterium]
MIVVIGRPALRGSGVESRADGLAAQVATAAAAAGSQVEFIGKIGDDPTGDELLLAFARASVGHVATLRDAAHPTAVSPGPDGGDADGTDPTDPDEAIGGAPLPLDDAGPVLEAMDIDLALRYLPDYGVIVVAHPTSQAVVDVAADAAAWAPAHLVVLLDPAGSSVEAPDTALVLAVDRRDGDGIGPLVGRYAAAIDDGADPATAFRATLAAASDPA